MRAAINTKYGTPSVIKITEIEKPQLIKPTDVLVNVKFSSVNRTDEGFLLANPFVTRFFSGVMKPKYIGLGCEFSGIVEAVGDEVSQFKPGDKVFGFDDQNFGGHAEYKIISENKMIVKVPDNIDLKQAAIALEGAHYALFYIYKIPKGAKVFVNGATGAIGSAAVQILKARGHYVEASSTTERINIVKKLGANKVVDWQNESISDEANTCDIYFDAVGKSSFAEARKILKPDGTYLSSELGYMGQNLLLSIINPIQKIFSKTNILFPIPQTRKQEAEIIAKHLADGSFQPLIDREYKLDYIREAHEYVNSGKKVGNVLIKIS